MLNELSAQNAHVARQHHDIGRIGVNFMHQLAVKGFAAGKLAGSQRVLGNTGLTRPLKAERVGLVAKYRPDGAWNPFLLTGIDNRL